MAIDNTVTRFPNGVTNVFENSVFANLDFTDTSIYHAFQDDFDKFTLAQWIAAGVNPVGLALVDGDGGLLSMATTGANNDSNILQQLNTAWTFVAGKKLFFRARAQVDNASLGLMGFGLQVAIAANNFLTPTDGVFIRKPAADTNVYLVSRVGGVETLSVALGVVANATPFEVSLSYDGQGNIIAALNNVVKASITPAAITAVPLRLTAAVQAGSVAARTMLLDQLICYKER